MIEISEETAQKIHATLVGADTLLREGKRAEARDLCLSVYDLCPEYPDTNQILGLIYLQDLEYRKAIGHLEAALKIFDNQPMVWIWLGEAYVETRQPDKAEKAFQKSLEFEPNFAEAYLRLGRVYLAQNKIAEAREALKKAVSLNPNLGQAHRFLAKLLEGEEAETLIDQYRQDFLKTDRANRPLMAEKAFALGQALDRRGMKTEAADYFLAGKALLLNDQNGWAGPYYDMFQKTKGAFSGDKPLPVVKENPDFQPIFIVGVPRSGSTLLEQILAAHGDVFGADEIRFSEGLFRKLTELAPNAPFPENLFELSADNLEDLVGFYRENVMALAPGKTIFVDKMLSNFHILGFLLTLFPNARFINIQRNPEDVCVSVIRNIFTVQTAPYLANPHGIGFYYHLYEDLMAFWKSRFPESILDVSYEGLVKKPDAEVKRIFDFCGLEYSPKVLEFFKSGHAVYSPSARQVRQKISADRIGGAADFSRLLEPFALAYGGAFPAARSEAQSAEIQRAGEKLDEEQFGRAKKICANLLAKDPFCTPALNGLGAVAAERERFREANGFYRRSLAINPLQPEIWGKLGENLINLREGEAAYHALQMALFIDPECYDGLFWLGHQMLGRGNFTGARTLLERAIKKDPAQMKAYWLLLKVPGFEPDAQIITALENKAKADDSLDAITAHYSLGVYYKKRDRAKFLDHLAAVNKKQRAKAPSNPNPLYLAAQAAQTFPAVPAKKRSAKKTAPTPIFIVGLPRTGSSLLEQMLSRHPDIAVADEVPFLNSHLIPKLLEITNKPYPEGVENLTPKDWQEIGAAYLNEMTPLARDKRFITDKLLSNGLFLGPAFNALPGAKAIHLRRNVFDMGLSIYSHYFIESLTFASDLEEMGQYLRGMEEAMAVWRGMYPDAILALNYEDLVAEPEKGLKRVMKFLGAPFEKDMLSYHKAKRAMLTLSLADVAQPLKKSSIGPGKDYLDMLAPLKDSIADLIDKDGFLLAGKA